MPDPRTRAEHLRHMIRRHEIGAQPGICPHTIRFTAQQKRWQLAFCDPHDSGVAWRYYKFCPECGKKMR